ncbi:MAG: NAD(P)H-dependent oxidoreductase subunit E [Spirochaetales bacterium]|nr:NAD(P)H-dependent oxidoreductase subunit E [Spirochaetales bacterium]
MSTQAALNFNNLCEILEKHNNDPAKLITILQEIQEVYRYLPEDIMTFVATSLGISPAKVYGVATFYSHFALKPKGKYVIKLCDGTACHVKKSTAILEALQTRLGLNEKNNTSSDGIFTIETVSCLGACGLAPVVMINEEVHGAMTPELALKEIDKIIQQEENKQ